jgi:hypothetical protein
MKILLLHGLLSKAGLKTALLEFYGHNVLRPHLSNWSLYRAIQTAQKAHDSYRPDLIVGSSRGGAVALALKSKVPLILMAPAWRQYGAIGTTNNPLAIIHGVNDRTIRLKDSLELCRNCPNASIEVVDDNHRLVGKGLIALMLQVRKFAGKLTGDNSMVKLSESDIVTVQDTAHEDFSGAVNFVQRKYGCSQEEAIVAVDGAIAVYSPMAVTVAVDEYGGDRFDEAFYGGTR